MRLLLGVVACVLAICALNLCAPLLVQSSTATPTPEVLSPTPVGAPGPTSQPESDSEAALLRAQLDVMRRYDERLVQTVYWALGTAFGLVLFAAGAGWYVNFRLYERDKQGLRTELRSEVETRSESIGRSLEQGLQEARTSLDQAIKKMTVDLHEEASRQREQIEKAALQAGKEAADSLQAQFEKMQREMLYMRYSASTSDAQRWREQGVHDNELQQYMESLTVATQLVEYSVGYEFAVARALEGIQEALRAGARPGVERATKLTEMLDMLPDKYSIEVERLRALISAARD
jgi:hypothetical protein